MSSHIAHPAGVAALTVQHTTHASAFVCSPLNPWTPTKFVNDATKTMFVHPNCTNQGGNQWKCPYCGVTYTSA